MLTIAVLRADAPCRHRYSCAARRWPRSGVDARVAHTAHETWRAGTQDAELPELMLSTLAKRGEQMLHCQRLNALTPTAQATAAAASKRSLQPSNMTRMLCA